MPSQAIRPLYVRDMTVKVDDVSLYVVLHVRLGALFYRHFLYVSLHQPWYIYQDIHSSDGFSINSIPCAR